MPLNTQIIRGGEPLSIRWGQFHIAAMVFASSWDAGKGPFKNNHPPTEVHDSEGNSFPLDYPNEPCPITPGDAFGLVMYHVIGASPLNGHDGYVLKGEHKFLDVTDGEVLHLLPGDKLLAFRN